MEILYSRLFTLPKKMDFPSLAQLQVPTRLSPTVDEKSRSQLPFERLSLSVVSVFDSVQAQRDSLSRAEFVLPQCYFRSYITHETEFKMKPQHVKQFSLDTLLYCFYYMPSDIMQAACGQELASRGWKYHSVLREWFRPATSDDGLPAGSKGLVRFDIKTWAKALCAEQIDQSKFLSPSDCTPQSTSLNFASLKTGPLRTPPLSPQAGPFPLPSVRPTSMMR